MTQAGMCFHHKNKSEYSFKTRRRHYDCCETNFVFGDALQIENKEEMSGCSV